MEPQHTQKYQIIIDIEEGPSAASMTPESALQEGWFDISITSDYGEAQTLDMLMEAYMDVAEDFFTNYARDPASYPHEFAAMHRRVQTLISEIRHERRRILDEGVENERPDNP